MKFNAYNKQLKIVSAYTILASMVVGNISPVFAQGNTLKEEVIYVNLKNDGKVNDIYVINNFDLSMDSNILDYGTYSDILNLSSENEINYDNGVIQTTSEKENNEFYYQGKLEETEIPWDIEIVYYLDGDKISAEELAGKSGNLEIEMKINKNDNVNEVFFDNYMLQIGVTLDSNNCSNTKAESGTIASVGSKKLITYMSLPGSENHYTISADVVDFEMDAITLNGLNMNMDIEINTDDMMEPFDLLADGVSELDNGVKELNLGIGDYSLGIEELNGGISEFNSGIGEYKFGVEEINKNMPQLVEGANDLNDGITLLNEGVDLLESGASDLDNGLKQLSQGSTEYKNNIDEYASSVSQIVEALKLNLSEEEVQALGLDNLVIGAQGLAIGYDSINDGINNSSIGASSINTGISELNQSTSVLSEGAHGLSVGLNELNGGFSILSTGINDIEEGSNELVYATNELKDGINQISTATLQIEDGTKELNTEVSKMPETIDEEISNMTSTYMNENFEPVSFTSEDNVNVESVQFTIKTDAISIEEIEEVVLPEVKEESLWDKFMNLFK